MQCTDQPNNPQGGFMKIAIIARVFLLAGILLALGNDVLLAQTIYTNNAGGGKWESGDTWQGGIPSASNDVIILPGDSVEISSANTSTIVVKSLTIQSNGKLASSFTVSGQDSLVITNALTIASNGWYYGNDACVSWPYAGSYSIDPASNYVMAPSASSTIGDVGRATFGNLINARTGSGSVCGASLTVLGDLTIMTGAGYSFKGTYRTLGNLTHHVIGNVKVISGQFCAVDDPTGGDGIIGTWNIDGNVQVGDPSTAPKAARFGPFASSDGGFTRTGIINIGGNLSLVNGARLQGGSSTGSSGTTEKGTINLKGNFTTDSTAIYATNSKGILSFNFNGTGTQTISLGGPLKFSSTSMLMTLNDTVDAGSTVVFNGGKTWSSGSSTPAINGDGAWVVNGTLSFGPANDTIVGYQGFVLNEGATLTTADTNGIDTLMGNIQVSGVRTFSTAANYGFDGSVLQFTGLAMPATVHNLTINNPLGVYLSQSTTVNGILNLAAGVLDTCLYHTVVDVPPANITGSGSIACYVVGVEHISYGLGAPREFQLYSNYPNPFNPATMIQFTVPKDGHAVLKVFNILGQEVATLFDGQARAGQYITAMFNASSLASGVYMAHLEYGGRSLTRRMVLAK
jgi:hypothetical protein